MHKESNDAIRLIEFAISIGMVISTTCFPQKELHKQTWISPNRVTKNQTDHILIDKRHATSTSDVRSLREASCGSDHLSAKARFRCHIYKRKKFIPKLSRINVSNLKDEAKVKELQTSMNEQLKEISLVQN